jgi:predicted methyltransferase MtxX (methanogen marker protein 4)
MRQKDYIKQLEEANQMLQAKLETQADDMDRLSAAFAQTRNEMKRSRLVVVYNEMLDMRSVDRGMLYNASLIVVPVTIDEKLKVYDKYRITNSVRLNLFKSIKDRYHKPGSIYDIDLLNKYSKGEEVTPYEL